MRVLLIGPYPPPHGGVSVHIYEACRQLRAAGIACRVVNLDRGAPPSADYLSVRSASGLLRVLSAHAGQGWTLHLHTNGHNAKSWLTALLCGLAGRRAPACVLTLHSGMLPDYLEGAAFRLHRRLLARLCCMLYGRVIAVSPRVRESLLALGVAAERLELQPAFLFPGAAPAELPPAIAGLLEGRRPVLSTALFFRPEYGFELLVEAVKRLRARYPAIGSVVMGSGEQRGAAQRLVCAAGLQDAILLAGDVTHEVSLAVQARSDVFVRPTLADGDSISVREAAALGVPVVASDVGMRPPEAILFESGDVDALVAAIQGALDAPRRGAAAHGASSPGRIGRLIQIYGDAARSETSADGKLQID